MHFSHCVQQVSCTACVYSASPSSRETDQFSDLRVFLACDRLYYPKHVNYDASLGKLALGTSGQVDWQQLDSPQTAP
jgi:hypothetical protein